MSRSGRVPNLVRARSAAVYGVTGLLLLLLLTFGAIPKSRAMSSPEPFLTASLAGAGSLTGVAWQDLDRDQVRDAEEPGLANVYVRLESLDDRPFITTVITDVTGRYEVRDLVPGNYRASTTAPVGYVATTNVTYNLLILADTAATVNFGFVLVPSPTPTVTALPILDISEAQQAYCGGVYSGDTNTGKSNVARYGCRPAWDESGPEIVYRIELDAMQPLTVTLLSSTVDLDLFLLRYVYPDLCTAAGDAFITHNSEAGVWLLAVDGYRGARGPYALRFDCGAFPQATGTPTFTPSPVPTATITLTPSRTPILSATPTPTPQVLFLPVILSKPR